MFVKKDPKEVAMAMISRSTCMVQVGACLADTHGVYDWGHNHVGFDGLGCHAEADCLRATNLKRLRLGGSTLYIAAQRQRTKHVVTARPCEACQQLLKKFVLNIRYRDGAGEWQTFHP